MVNFFLGFFLGGITMFIFVAILCVFFGMKWLFSFKAYQESKIAAQTQQNRPKRPTVETEYL